MTDSQKILTRKFSAQITDKDLKFLEGISEELAAEAEQIKSLNRRYVEKNGVYVHRDFNNEDIVGLRVKDMNHPGNLFERIGRVFDTTSLHTDRTIGKLGLGIIIFNPVSSNLGDKRNLDRTYSYQYITEAYKYI